MATIDFVTKGITCEPCRQRATEILSRGFTLNTAADAGFAFACETFGADGHIHGGWYGKPLLLCEAVKWSKEALELRDYLAKCREKEQRFEEIIRDTFSKPKK